MIRAIMRSIETGINYPGFLVRHAFDQGIRYFDTAWIYSDGQAETRLGKVVKHRRSEMWLATKTWDTTKDGARQQLETSLKRLQTDYGIRIGVSTVPGLTDNERTPCGRASIDPAIA